MNVYLIVIYVITDLSVKNVNRIINWILLKINVILYVLLIVNTVLMLLIVTNANWDTNIQKKTYV